MVRSGLAAIALLFAACGTDARGVDACRRIEEARCRRATGCGIDLGFIKYIGSGESNAVDGCIRYYHEACMHGLVAEEPGADKIQACVNVLQASSCDAIRAPETTTECNWLIPPAPAAPADAAAPTDAGSDAAPTP
jgi:hypothetical protein